METHADMQVLASETCLKLGEQVAQQGSETSLPPCCWGYHFCYLHSDLFYIVNTRCLNLPVHKPQPETSRKRARHDFPSRCGASPSPALATSTWEGQ